LKQVKVSRKKVSRPIYTLDAETDPFLYGRIPMPFAWGFYKDYTIKEWQGKGAGYCHHTWGKNCTEEMMEYLSTQDAGIIYAHNGGRFDLFFLLKYIAANKKIRITNNRIILCYIPAANGGFHELRDSYKIFPASLDSYQKTKIDYRKMERNVRNKHKKEIQDYLYDDCRYLHNICCEFLREYGNHLTIGSAALYHLKKFHDIGESLTWKEDRDIRSKYYYGGRVQCFVQGMVQQNMQYVDVNSMYPYVMANYYHPKGHPTEENRRIISDKTFFVTVEGINHNALPMRMQDGGIRFDVKQGVFHCTIHEYLEAVKLGRFETHNILRTVDFEESIKFDAFVNHFYTRRQNATDTLEKCAKYSEEWFHYKLHKDLNKNLLNNGYGKLGINPDNQLDYLIAAPDESLFGWFDEHQMCQGDCGIIDDFGDRHYACNGYHFSGIFGDNFLWKKPSSYARVLHVAMGASITGAARSYLLRWIDHVEQPLYCDTDSLIFSGSLDGLPIHASALGSLKVEHADLDELAACGKKLYAIWRKGECMKVASKGGKLTEEQMREIAIGGGAISYNAAPTFSLSGKTSFQMRTFRMT
jgi:hypothetical protein